MNDDSSGGKISIIYFCFANVKGNWAHLAGKNSRPEAKTTTIF